MNKRIIISIALILICIGVIGFFIAKFIWGQKIDIEFKVSPDAILRTAIDREYNIELVIRNMGRRTFSRSVNIKVERDGKEITDFLVDFSQAPLGPGEEKILYSESQKINSADKTVEWKAHGLYHVLKRSFKIGAEKQIQIKKFLSLEDIYLLSSKSFQRIETPSILVLEEFLIGIEVKNIGPRQVVAPLTAAFYIDGEWIQTSYSLMSVKTKLDSNEIFESFGGATLPFRTPGKHTILVVLNPVEELFNIAGIPSPSIGIEKWISDNQLVGEDFLLKKFDVIGRKVQKGNCKANAYEGDECQGYRCIKPNTKPLEKCYRTYDECFDDQSDFTGDCIPAPLQNNCKGYLYHPGMGRVCYTFDQCQEQCLFPL